jgi:hypothetical protein
MGDTPELKIGMKLKDNDPRMTDRVMMVCEIGATKVTLRSLTSRPFSTTRVSKERLHLDGKRRRSGWSLVP